MTDNPIVWTYPREWYRFSKLSFQLRSASLVSARPWAGGNNIYGPHAQMWMPKFTASVMEETVWPEISAFFDELGGQAGLLRIGDPSRVTCAYNRARKAEQEAFSDDTMFTDDTGFIDGFMPSTAYLIAPAKRGDTFAKIGGLLPSTTKALARGDLIEFQPNGVADMTPRLHSVTLQGNTNANGECGVKIAPPLRAGLAAGDQVALDYATSIFHLIDDSQAEIEITPPLFGNFGFSLIEAIENV